MSNGWHLGTLCAFDTETTSADPTSARLVTACIAYVDGTGAGSPVVREWLADPGVEIPEDAAKVHGITTGHAREHGRPERDVAGEVAAEVLKSAGFPSLAPVIAYNAPFDLTLMDRATRRHGLEPFGPALDAERVLVIDPFVMDKALDPYRKGKRNLTAVAAHYGVRQDQAHSASGDAITAARIAWAIANRNPHIARMTATELMAWQAKERREQARSFEDYLRRMNDYRPVDGSWPWTPLAEEAVA